MTWSGYLLSIPFARRQPLLDRHSHDSGGSSHRDPCKIPARTPLRNCSDSVFGHVGPPLPDLASSRDTLLAAAAVDRTGADELPAVAMVGRLARLADDAGRDDRLAADLADRRPRVGGLGGADRDDRDALAQPRGHALAEPVVD